MRLHEIQDEQAWETWMRTQPHASFCQSWAWGELQKSVGHDVRRFALVDVDATWLLAVQWIRQERRFGMGYWFAPRGPVFSKRGKEQARACMETLFESLELPGRTLMYRCEPSLTLDEGHGAFPLGFRFVHSISPADTRLINVSRSEEELLADLHQKTRYNIRLAQKQGVTVREGSMADMEKFLRLTHETATRDGITPLPDAYLQATFERLPLDMVTIRLAEHEGAPLAATIEIQYGDTRTYLHGASSGEKRSLQAPSLIQWEAIRTAKLRGAHWYDFWGANPSWKGRNSYKPSWKGITRFKEGFGGREMNMTGTWDLPVHPWIHTLLIPIWPTPLPYEEDTSTSKNTLD